MVGVPVTWDGLAELDFRRTVIMNRCADGIFRKMLDSRPGAHILGKSLICYKVSQH